MVWALGGIGMTICLPTPPRPATSATARQIRHEMKVGPATKPQQNCHNAATTAFEGQSGYCGSEAESTQARRSNVMQFGSASNCKKVQESEISDSFVKNRSESIKPL